MRKKSFLLRLALPLVLMLLMQRRSCRAFILPIRRCHRITGQTRTESASTDLPDGSCEEETIVSDVQRRETLTGAGGMAALLLSLELMGKQPMLQQKIGGTLPSSKLTAALLEGDTVIRNLWLNRLTYPVLVVALEMGFFEALKSGRLDKVALGSRLSPKLAGDGRALEAIVAVLASLGLLKVNDEASIASGGGNRITVELTDAARLVLLRGSPHYWGHQLLAADGLTASLRRAVYRDEEFGSHRAVPYSAHSQEQILSFIGSMQSHGSVTALATAEALSPILGPTSTNPATHILDMAGGSGCFAEAMRDAFGGSVQLTLADIPSVVTQYRQEHKQIVRTVARQHGKVDAVPADLFQAETWPVGPDVHFLANVLHDWDRDKCVQILRNSHRALMKSSATRKNSCRLVVVEQLLDETKTGPLPAALASVSMLLGDWRTGKEYSFSELEMMMLEAGFKGVERGPSCGDFHTSILAYTFW